MYLNTGDPTNQLEDIVKFNLKPPQDLELHHLIFIRFLGVQSPTSKSLNQNVQET